MISDHLRCLMQNGKLTAFSSNRASELVDGYGVKKVVNKIYPPNISIRLAEERDSENIFHWRNADETRQYIYNQEIIPWESHLVWFQSIIINPDRQLLIGEIDQKPIGVIRYDFDKKDALISIYLIPGLSNNGMGTALIHSGNQWIKTHHPKIKRVLAEVFPSNQGSRKAFENVGFRIKNCTFQYNF
jgi:UDP-2,4-diacetamido-2,4,6-trideoxy-beta-L-altropyranose hydrolase